jgi:ABC-2 type transport system permease protein
MALIRQLKFDWKRFWRDPSGIFYALGLPAVFLIVFMAIIGGEEEPAQIAGHTVSNKPYYVAAIMVLTVVSVTFVNLAVSLTAARERGTLKRVRGTRLPPWVFMAGRIGTAIIIVTAAIIAVALAGLLVYGVELPTTALPGALLALVIGTAALSSLAFALTIVMPSANTAAAVTMVLTLVLYFISGIFAREDIIPHTIRQVAEVFPVKRLFESLVIAYDPATTGAGIHWTGLAVMAAWGIGGLIVALKFFRWMPSTE